MSDIPKIFISYSREDRDRVRPLAEALEKQGWTVEWDPELRARKRYADIIEGELDDAFCVIVLWSKHSVRSRNVKNEATFALKGNKLLPVMIDKVDIPLEFKRFNTLDLSGWQGETDDPQLERLFDSVRQIISASIESDDESATISRQRQENKKTDPDFFSGTSDGSTISTPEQQSVEEPVSDSMMPEEKAKRRFRFPASIDLLQLFRASLIAVVAIAAVAGSVTAARIGIAEMGVTRALSSAVQPCTSVPGEGPQMVIIPSGVFKMGSAAGDANADSDEFPAHNVSISKDFAIGRCEVTHEAFARFAEATGRELPPDNGWGRGRQPVTDVAWQDAVAYTEWLSEQTGKRYRLPTEAEWEYVARAATDTKYWWGDDIQQDGQVWANCRGCGSQWDGKQTAPVSSFDPNAFGVYDTAGNVWEWVQDCWHEDYQGAPAGGSALQADRGDCGRRVIRGGSWSDVPRYLRSAFRYWNIPDFRDNGLGFRLAQDL